MARLPNLRSNPFDLHGREVDLLIVGGGIHGAAFAREAAVRGASVALVERSDFVAGTSARSSRLIHGGVRYLEQGHIRLVREALRERERLLRGAPHLVRPLPMLMPFYAGAGKAAWKLRLGLKLYDVLAGRSTMPRSRAYRAKDCLRLFPGLRAEGLRGGVLYYDAATEDVRLTTAVLLAAAEAGATLCNYVEVVGAADGAVHLREQRSGADLRVHARCVVNATGPRVDALRARLGIDGPDLVRASRGSHLVLPPLGIETALAAFLSDGRIQFVVPHPTGTLLGTTEVAGRPAEDEPGVPDEDVDYLLGAAAQLLARPPGRGDVLSAYCGWRSLPAGTGPAGQLNREAYLVEERSAAGPVHSVVGGKLTTHRAFAERGVGQLLGVTGASPTRTAPLPGGAGPREPEDPLWWRYGCEAAAVRALAHGSPELLQPCCPHREVLGVEVVWGVRRLGAVQFSDLLLRRLFDVRGPCLVPECLAAMHALFAAEGDLTAAAGYDADVAALRAELDAQLGAVAAPSCTPISP